MELRLYVGDCKLKIFIEKRCKDSKTAVENIFFCWKDLPNNEKIHVKNNKYVNNV